MELLKGGTGEWKTERGKSCYTTWKKRVRRCLLKHAGLKKADPRHSQKQPRVAPWSPPNFPSVLATLNLFRPAMTWAINYCRNSRLEVLFPSKGIFMSAISIGPPCSVWGNGGHHPQQAAATLHPHYDR